MIRNSHWIGAAALALAFSTSANAVVVAEPDRSNVGSDSVNWALLGPQGTPIVNGATVTSADGNVITITSAGAQRLDQSSGWGGNFAPGDPLVRATSTFLTLTFANAVSSVGAQIQRNFFGSFTGQIAVNGGALGTFTRVGNSNGANNNSAIFLGVRSDAADITSITYSLVGDSDFAINGLSLSSEVNGAVPEPGTWLLMILGFGMIGFAMRARKPKVRMTVSYARA